MIERVCFCIFAKTLKFLSPFTFLILGVSLEAEKKKLKMSAGFCEANNTIWFPFDYRLRNKSNVAT